MNTSLFDAANKALDCGDADKAFRLFMQDAQDGGPDSLNSIGFLYDHGRGVKKTAGLPFNGIAWLQAKDILSHALISALFTKMLGERDWPGSGSRKHMRWAILTRRMSWAFYMHARHPGIYLPADQSDIFWQCSGKNV